MAETIISFTGNVADLYEELLGPSLFEPFAIDLAGHVADHPSSSILELACGTGRLTRHLLTPMDAAGLLVATDINPGMLAVARREVSDPRIRWSVADMMDLPFGNGEFDSVVSQFGMMFPGDKDRAFGEARRVLRKGGRLLFNTWAPATENMLWSALGQQMRIAFGDTAEGPIAVPFALSQEGPVSQQLLNLGFSEVSSHTVRLTVEFESAAIAARGMIMGTPVINFVRDLAPEALPGMLERLELRYVELFGNHPMVAPVMAKLFEAEV
jgi:ubiquinone/menaquinone biosynthesis C-methylase UbiE